MITLFVRKVELNYSANGAWMANEKLIRINCQNCHKKLGIREDQHGRRVRCPACKTAFLVDSSFTQQSGSEKSTASEPEENPKAEIAGELVISEQSSPTSVSAKFDCSPEVLFDAIIFAIGRVGGQLQNQDRKNLEIRFQARTNGIQAKHRANITSRMENISILELEIMTPGISIDETLYGRIAAELLAYIKSRNASDDVVGEQSDGIPPKRRKNTLLDHNQVLCAVLPLLGSTISLATVLWSPTLALAIGIVTTYLSLMAAIRIDDMIRIVPSLGTILSMLGVAKSLLIMYDAKYLKSFTVIEIIVMTIAFIVTTIFWLIYYSEMHFCRNCRKGLAIVHVDSKVVETRKCYGLVTRSSYSSRSVKYHGRTGYENAYETGSSTWQERVPVIRTTVLHSFQCKFCGVTYQRQEVTEKEDFNI